MNIFKSLKKINELTPGELRHCVQELDLSISNYKKHLKNYSYENMKKCGIPYLKELESKRQKFIDKLNPVVVGSEVKNAILASLAKNKRPMTAQELTEDINIYNEWTIREFIWDLTAAGLAEITYDWRLTLPKKL